MVMSRGTLVALTVCASGMVCNVAMGEVSPTTGFESGMSPWSVRSSGESTLSAAVVLTNQPVHSGQWAAQMTASGRAGTGCVWLETKVPVAAGTYTVDLSFWVWEPRGIPNWNVVGLLDSKQPQGQSEFHTLHSASGDAEWKLYSMEQTVTVRGGEAIFVGIGGATVSRVDAKLVFDDVAVTIAQTACAADFDHSGATTIADIFSFLNAWLAGSTAADYDGSGRLDAADIFAFVNDWFTGCTTT
jgi:hypothetical protein